MSGEKVTEQELTELRLLFSRPGSDPVRAERVVLAIDELLQRRRDGQSPEEFVVLMAGRVGDIKPGFQAHYLQGLAEIRRATSCIRQYVAGRIDD